MEPIVVFGAGGDARVVIDAIEQQGRYQVKGLIDRADSPPRSSPRPIPIDYPTLGEDSDLPAALDGVSKGIVAIGDNHRRLEIVERIQKLVKSFEFVTVIHPSAVVAKSVTLGAGTVVMAGAVINPGTKVGRHCIINTRASIDHDNQIEDFASLGPGAITGGCVKIGRGTAIALGAKIIDGINIGAQTVIGAGATVLADAQDLVVAYGTPARVIRDRKAGDPYL